MPQTMPDPGAQPASRGRHLDQPLPSATGGISWLEQGDLLSVPGIRGAALAAGIKESGDPDLALVVLPEPWSAAGVFTRSQLPAAPVVLCRERLRQHAACRALVINSGNANAITGEQGEQDARQMAATLERLCGGPALVMSTGIIGVPMPMEQVLAGMERAAEELSHSCGQQLARAILTTDTCIKTCAVRLQLPDGGQVTVGGVAKGSGMIHPDMATMLAVLATDAPLEADLLDATLRAAVDRSFHEITVDGDTSTNDTVLLLSRPAPAGHEPLAPASPSAELVAQGVQAVAQRLAQLIVADGEGASRVMELSVLGLADEASARKVARAVCTSSLVKTALAGGDPNWGRILAAAATAGVELTPEQLWLRIGGLQVVERGQPVACDQAAVTRAFQEPHVEVELGLGRGPGRAHMLTSDLTTEYVHINADYTT